MCTFLYSYLNCRRQRIKIMTIVLRCQKIYGLIMLNPCDQQRFCKFFTNLVASGDQLIVWRDEIWVVVSETYTHFLIYGKFSNSERHTLQ